MPAIVPLIVKAVVAAKAWWAALSTAGKIWAVAKGVMAVGSVVYSSNQARKMKRAMKSGLNKGRTFMSRSAVAPRQIIYGQVKTSGPIVFMDTVGTNNEYVQLIVVLAGHECEEITSVYFNDDLLTLDGSGNVTSQSYGGYATVSKFLGTAAQSVTVPSTTPRWTASHRLRGVCCVSVRLKWSSEVFPQGIPNISALVKGRKVYDPRTATTVYSNNWALCVADYLADSDLGVGHDFADIDDTALQAAANISDENVTLNPSGTEKRYAVNGVILTDSAPGDVLQQLIFSGAGFCGYIGGKWHIHAGAYRTPTITIDESQLVGPLNVQTRLSRKDIFNAAKGVFTSPETDWQPSDYPVVTNTTYQTSDGEQIWQNFEWPFITSSAMAQRVSKISLERVRQEISVQLQCNLTAVTVQAGDNIMLTNSRMGWTSKVFEVMNTKFVPDEEDGATTLGYNLELRETASSVWDWANGEETVIDTAPNTNLPDPSTVVAPTGLTLTSDSTTTSLQADGSVIPRILVEWTAPADEFVVSGGTIRVEYKLNAASEWNFWAFARGDEVENYITSVIIGQSYNVRIKSEQVLGASSSWVTATATAAGDLVAPGTPASLVATAGAGFISLDWADNTEADLSEYGVYRHTANVFGSATKIAEVRASRFMDAGVTASTAYYYWITAIDRSENEGTQSTSATATATAPIDVTAPSTPSAPTYSSEGTYLSGDGTVFAYIVIDTPALPSGAIALDVLYRIDGSASWILADQLATDTTARIDDLSPGVAYEFAVRGVSNGGALSTVSTVLDRTAPNKTTGPGAVTSITMTAANCAPFINTSISTNNDWCSNIAWVKPSDKDVSYYEIKVTNTDSDAAVDYRYTSYAGVSLMTTEETHIDVKYNFNSPVSGYVRIRAYDITGNAGAWASGGQISSSVRLNGGAGDLASQKSSATEVSGIQTGSGASVVKIVARFEYSEVKTLTGGSPTETVSFSLTNRGFGTKPDQGQVQCASNSLISCRYNFDHASNSSTVAYVELQTIDGSNIPAGAQRFSLNLTEFS